MFVLRFRVGEGGGEGKGIGIKRELFTFMGFGCDI